MGLALKDIDLHDYSDYLQWQDNHYELIASRAYCMAPAPNLEYQEVVGEVFRQVAHA